MENQQPISQQRLNELHAAALSAFRIANNESQGSIDPTAYSVVAAVDTILRVLGIEVVPVVAEEEQERQDEIQEENTDMEQKLEDVENKPEENNTQTPPELVREIK